MGDDLAALTTRTVAAAFCIGSHFDGAIAESW